MAAAKFIHLHTHTEYSLLDGASRIDDLIETACKFEMPSLAITDHGAMYGNISFYTAAKSAGIKPILGCEVYVAVESRLRKNSTLDKEQYHLVLLAQNEEGYRNLIKLVSIAHSEGFYYKPRVDKELLAQYCEGLIAMTACLGGEVPTLISRNDLRGAKKAIADYADIFGRDSLYLELQDHGLPEQRPVNEALIQIARESGLKLIATNDIHYTAKEDADAHDVLLCIQTGSNIDDPNRMRFGSREFYMKSPQDMEKLFGHIPESLANTFEIAERCNLNLKFGATNLPNPGIPKGMTPADYMCAEALNGLRKRLGGELTEEYRAQFEYECGVINQCGFNTYMLIVRDFTDFARRQGIYVGVRGSAAGSLVCYGLGITDVDPIEYGLTFERFLNPERVEMPDVDLDIQDDRREELIQYVTAKYGRDRVGQIATFGSLKARAAVRDCGRVLGMDLAEVDKICKMIPAIPVGVTIDRALEENPDLQSAYRSRPDVRKLIDTARSLEGLNRNVGVHAAGVLISDDPLTDHVPVQVGEKGELVAQLAKKDIAKVGLLKMDFLGLANLTILAEAVKLVKRHRGIDIDILNIPLDDLKTFEMLSRGDTSGVFQLESAGMRRNVVELKPNSVRELAAIVALYRPGPMAYIPKFIRSKFGQEPITYLHPDLEPILKETYGVICYQDQVLRIACAIAGFTLGQADVLRKAMSSKDRATMDKQRERFLEGAKSKGIAPKIAEKIYEQIEPFAGYAFNKAHAVCYAFVAYRTAYMKANYPVEYYTALLTANMDDKEKLSLYVEDCKRLGITVLPPDVNSSKAEFEVESGAIRFGLAAIKGCGKTVIDGIVAAREAGGRFTDLFDFCRRAQEHVALNKSTIECLIKVGAFAFEGANRAQLLEMLPDAMGAAASRLRERRTGQTYLFEGDSDAICSGVDSAKYAHVGEFGRNEILAMERDLVGLYLSGHPLDDLRGTLEKYCTANASTYRDLENDQECVIGGIITDIRYRVTRRNERMAVVRIEDLYGSIPVTFFPAAFKNCSQHIAYDKIVLISGRASHRERIAADEDDTMVEVEILGESISPFKTAKNTSNGKGSRSVHIRINGLPALKLDTLKSLIEAYPGDMPVYFHLCHNGTRQKIATAYAVEATTKFVAEVERLLGKDVVRIG